MKKIIFSILICALTFSNVAFAQEIPVFPPFPDVGLDFVYKDAIQDLKDEEVINGYDDGTFKPKNPINRAEFLKIVMEASGHEISGSHCYKDVNDEWFAPYVCAATLKGFVDGYEDGNFRPAQNINFAEASKIVANTLGLNVDEKYIDTWFEKYVVSIEEEEAIPNSVTRFDHEMNRGEMSYMVWRATRDYRLPYYKETLTYADIKALADIGLNLKWMEGLGPHNFYTDGNSIYGVSFAKISIVPLADPENFSLFDSENSFRLFTSGENMYFLDEHFVFSVIKLDDIDVATAEILITNDQMLGEVVFDSYDHEIGDNFILMRDKDGLYIASALWSSFSEVKGVNDVPNFLPIVCYLFCGVDDDNFYYLPSMDSDFVIFEGIDNENFEYVLDGNGYPVARYFKDLDYVYDLDGTPVMEPSEGLKIIEGADPATFEIIVNDDIDLFAKDDDQVWEFDRHLRRSIEIEGADPDTFDYLEYIGE